MLQLAYLRRQVAFRQLRILPWRFVQRSRKDDLGQAIHPFGHLRINLERQRCRPVAGHELVGDPAEHEQTSALGVVGDECIILRVGLGPFRPAQIAVHAGKVTIQRHVVEND